MKNLILIAMALLMCCSASAKRKCSAFSCKEVHANYQIGTLESQGTVDTGTFTSCDHGCTTRSTGHNVHYVTTPDGAYAIEAPTNLGLSILSKSDIYVKWFMDSLNPGDKVLFTPECNKNNDCKFFLPKPEKPGDEYHTTGWFRPRVATTNTTQLCGTGKLSADVEAQVCTPQGTPAPEPTPSPEAAPSPAEQAKTAQAYADCLKLAVDNPKIVCQQ